jgi:hypothetical protein
MKRRTLCWLALPLLASGAYAAVSPALGTAGAFAVLGASTVTNTGATVINGNLGLSPGGAVTGFPPGVVVPPGTMHVTDAVASGAQNDTTIAYNSLAGQACNFNLTGQDLGGLTLISGVYCFSSSAQLTGALTLNAQGDPNAVFIFQIGSSLTTASNSSVNIINGGSGCNVFWQVGSSATLGTATSFKGNILALTSITLNTGAILSGRALAHTGAVTLDSNTISLTECSATLVLPPVIADSFVPPAIGLGGTSTKSFTISNPNAVPLTGIAFTDALPAGLIVSTPNGVTGNSGGGTITAVAGSGSISLAGAILAGGASLTFSVSVTGTTTGTKSNSVTVTSTNGGTGNTSGTSLTVLQALPAISPPTIVKAFGAATIAPGGITTLSFAINNPNGAVALTGVAFADTLPAGLAVSTPNGLMGSCGGGTITAVAGSGSVSLTGATLAAGATCAFSVNVTGTATGTQNNVVAVSSSNGGSGNTSATSVIVSAAVVVQPPAISKAFDLLTIPVGQTSLLSFTILNPNIAGNLTVAFTDTLPAGLVVSSPNGVTGSCGGGTVTAVPGSGVISLTGGVLAPNTSCTFGVRVTATSDGPKNNSVQVTSLEGSSGNTGLASIIVMPAGTAGSADFLIRYASNLGTGDSVINITNTGVSGGSICANVYAFSPDEQLISCCSCTVTPSALVSLSVRADLISNTLTPALPTSIVVKLLASTGPCNAAVAAPGGSGLLAWGTTVHALPAGAFAVTESAFQRAGLSAAEFARITSFCGFAQANGSGFGLCRSCRLGGQGATKQ